MANNKNLHYVLSSPLIAFYLGQDSEGRFPYSLTEIIEDWDEGELEYNHDYIQWLFPLTEESSFNPDAPIISQEEIYIFTHSKTLQKNVLKSLTKILNFYGFICNNHSDSIKIQRSSNYEECIQNWVTPYNHNYRRITRILKSLVLLGLNQYATAFLEALKEVYTEESHTIGETTYNYWLIAVKS